MREICVGRGNVLLYSQHTNKTEKAAQPEGRSLCFADCARWKKNTLLLSDFMGVPNVCFFGIVALYPKKTQQISEKFFGLWKLETYSVTMVNLNDVQSAEIIMYI